MTACRELFDYLPSILYETNNFDPDCRFEKIVIIRSADGPRFLKRLYNIVGRPFEMGWFNEKEYYFMRLV